MALQIVPSKKLPPVKRSLVLAFVGIPQRRPLSPNGRVFRKLAGEVPAVCLDHGELVEMTYEEAFTVRVMRWLPATLQHEFGRLFEPAITEADRAERIRAFTPKLQAHKKACPPPWEMEPAAQAARERAA